MAETTEVWTLAELHRLPDDGNKYELVRGELFVTPPPNVSHESLASALSEVIEPYVVLQWLGKVFRPRAVVRIAGSEVEPDLMVRADVRPLPKRWEDAPVPILVAEILSDSTRRRDHVQKREFYLESGVAQYWIVDGDNRNIRVMRAGARDMVATTEFAWHPVGASVPLVVDVAQFFRDALG